VQAVAGEEDGQQQRDDELGDGARDPQDQRVGRVFQDADRAGRIRGEQGLVVV
jgi:hypothetical protein